MKKNKSYFFLAVILTAFSMISPSALAGNRVASCGGFDQQPCTITQAFPSCDSGFAENSAYSPTICAVVPTQGDFCHRLFVHSIPATVVGSNPTCQGIRYGYHGKVSISLYGYTIWSSLTWPREKEFMNDQVVETDDHRDICHGQLKFRVCGSIVNNRTGAVVPGSQVCGQASQPGGVWNYQQSEIPHTIGGSFAPGFYFLSGSNYEQPADTYVIGSQSTDNSYTTLFLNCQGQRTMAEQVEDIWTGAYAGDDPSYGEIFGLKPNMASTKYSHIGTNTLTTVGAMSPYAKAFDPGAKVFGGAPGVVYVIDANGNLYQYRYTDAGGDVGPAQQIGSGWGGLKVFSGGAGILYTIDSSGGLYYYRHFPDGQWLVTHQLLGSDWGGFKETFSAGHGVIYGITTGGDLMLYRLNPDLSWKNAGAGQKVDSGWGGFTKVFAGLNGKIYGVEPDGSIYVYKLNSDGTIRSYYKVAPAGWNQYGNYLTAFILGP